MNYLDQCIEYEIVNALKAIFKERRAQIYAALGRTFHSLISQNPGSMLSMHSTRLARPWLGIVIDMNSSQVEESSTIVAAPFKGDS